MKSNGDSPNSGECVVLKTVSPQILDKLRESGLTVCICCEFKGTAWLVFRPGLPFDVHGEGYDFEELGLIGTEANLRYFEKLLQTILIVRLMLISLLTPVYNLSKLTVFNFEFNNSETNLVRRLEK